LRDLQLSVHGARVIVHISGNYVAVQQSGRIFAKT
jgi:hypothetical protein